MSDKYEATCEATATIGERWRFDLPEDWQAMPDDEKEDALAEAAMSGECVADWVIGNEETREWDLDSLQVPEDRETAPDETEGAAASVEQACVQACSNLAEYLNENEDRNDADLVAFLAEELVRAGYEIKDRETDPLSSFSILCRADGWTIAFDALPHQPFKAPLSLTETQAIADATAKARKFL